MFKLLEDLNKAVKEFPGLKIMAQGKFTVLEGRIEIVDEETESPIDTFDVSISFPASFPFRFPKVTETGGKIPRNDPNRHVYPDNTLCLAPPPEEILLCRHGITTTWFVKSVLIPRLAEEYLVNHGGKYLHEYDHGSNGLWGYYFKKLNTTDEKIAIELLKTLRWPNLERQIATCPCNSGKKFKKCHSISTSELAFLPSDFIDEQIQLLVKNKYKNV